MNGKYLERQTLVFTRNEAKDLQRKYSCTYFRSQPYPIEKVKTSMFFFIRDNFKNTALESLVRKKGDAESGVLQEGQVLILSLHLD